MFARKAKTAPVGMRLSEFLKAPPAQPKPIYVLAGSDPYLLHEGRRAVRASVFGDTDPGAGLEELDGPEADLARVLDTLRTPPLLAPRRLVFVRDADVFVQRAREALEKYLDAPAPDAALCLQVAKWNPGTELGKRVARLGLCVQCETTQPHRIPAWLTQQARKRHGKELPFAAAQMLVEHLGPDMGALVSALEMLDLYTGQARAIDTSDIDALIARGHHERVWAMADAVAERRLARALELLDAFWAEGMAAPQIVGLLRVQLRQLVRASAFGRRMGLDAAMAKAGVPRGAFARVRRALEAFSADHLAAAYQALVDADLAAKTSAHERLAMETLVHRLCNPEAARLAADMGDALE